jgi:hypothetical protein
LLAKSAWRFRSEGVRTTAVVVGYDAREQTDSDGRRRTYHYPQVEFVDLAGQKQRVTMGTGCTSLPFAQNSTVRIIYPPGKPWHAEFGDFMDAWLWPGFWLLMAAFFFAFAYNVWSTRVPVAFHFIFG